MLNLEKYDLTTFSTTGAHAFLTIRRAVKHALVERATTVDLQEDALAIELPHGRTPLIVGRNALISPMQFRRLLRKRLDAAETAAYADRDNVKTAYSRKCHEREESEGPVVWLEVVINRGVDSTDGSTIRLGRSMATPLGGPVLPEVCT